MQVANAWFIMAGIFRYQNRATELKEVLSEYLKCQPETSYVNSCKIQQLVEMAYDQFYTCR